KVDHMLNRWVIRYSPLFDAAHYQAMSAFKIESEKVVAMCLNSTLKHYLRSFLELSDILIIDEVRQVLEAINSATIKKADRVLLFDLIRKCITQTPLIICAAADIDGKTISFIKSCDREIYHIERDIEPKQKTLFYSDYADVKTIIHEAIDGGEYCLVMVDTIQEAETLKEKCEQQNISHLCVTGENSGDDEQREFLSNPNKDNGYQVVIATQ
ncbi:hypothetical protein, partial [Bathymodiolus japonicus methanotrophic gill symbiont]|uniref:hypothetical protein n=1 Tax=Bathymodiolus japonicus methanotrophic gill symbiont TaxID=113269 RepID=UPI001C8DD5D4